MKKQIMALATVLLFGLAANAQVETKVQADAHLELPPPPDDYVTVFKCPNSCNGNGSCLIGLSTRMVLLYAKPKPGIALDAEPVKEQALRRTYDFFDILLFSPVTITSLSNSKEVYFLRTNHLGRFTLDSVPPGNYAMEIAIDEPGVTDNRRKRCKIMATFTKQRDLKIKFIEVFITS